MKLNKIGPGVVSVKTWALVIVVANVNSAAVGKKVAGVVADALKRAGFMGDVTCYSTLALSAEPSSRHSISPHVNHCVLGTT